MTANPSTTPTRVSDDDASPVEAFFAERVRAAERFPSSLVYLLLDTYARDPLAPTGSTWSAAWLDAFFARWVPQHAWFARELVPDAVEVMVDLLDHLAARGHLAPEQRALLVHREAHWHQALTQGLDAAHGRRPDGR